MKKILIFTLIFVLSILIFSFSMEFAGATTIGTCTCKAERDDIVMCVPNKNDCEPGDNPICTAGFGECQCSCRGRRPGNGNGDGGPGTHPEKTYYSDITKDTLKSTGTNTIINAPLFKFYAKRRDCKTGCDDNYKCIISCPEGYTYVFANPSGLSSDCSRDTKCTLGACISGCTLLKNTKCWGFCVPKDLDKNSHMGFSYREYQSCSKSSIYGHPVYAAWKMNGRDDCVLVYSICKDGFENCDNNWWTNGCEVNVVNDPNNCGSCGNKCNTNAFCDKGCKCNQGFNNCDNSWENGCEVNVLNDMNNCGECNNNCVFKHMTSCQNGECTGCESGWEDCDDDLTNGCETEVLKNVNNCGSCNNKCSSGYSCKEGSCLYGSFSKAIHFVQATGRIENNQILIEKDALPEARYDGIYLDSCKNVEINKNKIKSMSEGDIGIYIIDSKEIILNENEVIASANAVALSKSITAIEITESEEEFQIPIPQPLTPEEELISPPIPVPFQSKPKEPIPFELAKVSVPTQEGLKQQPSEKSITPAKPIPKPLTIDITLNSNLMCANGIDFESKHGGLITGDGNTFTESSSKDHLENFKVKECSPVEIDSCQDLELDSTVYVLTKDIEDYGSGPCFTIKGGKDIVLNCQDHYIREKTTFGSGMSMVDGNDIAITNCKFWGYGTGGSDVGINVTRGQDIKIFNNEFKLRSSIILTDVGSSDSDETAITSNDMVNSNIKVFCQDASELYNRIQNKIGPSIIRNEISHGSIKIFKDSIISPESFCGSPLIQLNKITKGGARGVGAIQTNVPCSIYGNEIISPVAIGIVANYNQGLWKEKPWLFPKVGIAGNIIDIPETDGNKIGIHFNDLTKTRVEDNIVVNKGDGAGVKFYGHFKDIEFKRNIVCKEFKGEGGKGGKGDYNDIDCSSAVEFAISNSRENIFSSIKDSGKCGWVASGSGGEGGGIDVLGIDSRSGVFGVQGIQREDDEDRIVKGGGRRCDCEHYNPNTDELFCGDGIIQGEGTYGTGYGEECEKDSDCGYGENCIYCQCTSLQSVDDSICLDYGAGYVYYLNHEFHQTCSEFNVWEPLNVKPNFLDYIVDDALDCCIDVRDDLVSPHHGEYCEYARFRWAESPRDCLTAFITRGIKDGYHHPVDYQSKKKVQWCRGYFEAELGECCFGEETACLEAGGVPWTCTPDVASNGAFFNDYIKGLTCDDRDCKLRDQPALKTATVLNTGTCTDWSVLTTTLLRKTGYFPSSGGMGDGVYSVSIPKHTMNLVFVERAGKFSLLDAGLIKSSPGKEACEAIKKVDMIFSDNFVISPDSILNPFVYKEWIDFVETWIKGCEDI